jgi:hypothetical protein
VGRWGSLKKLAAAADGSLWLSYKRGLLERYSEGGKLLWSSSTAASTGGPASFKPAGVLGYLSCVSGHLGVACVGVACVGCS